MRDKSLSIFLIALFGISGLAIMALAWMRPMPVADRILSTFIGSSGLLVVFSQAVVLKSLSAKEKAEQVPVELKDDR